MGQLFLPAYTRYVPAYLDHAASTPMRPEAVAAMLPFLSDHPGNPSGGHAVARAAKTALEEAREDVAAVLGCAPGEVVFTGGGTEADNLAVKGAARARLEAGVDAIVTSAIEHKGVLASAQRLETEGFTVTRVGVDRGGIVDLDQLADALGEHTAVVSVMLVNNEVGTIQPLADVAALVAERAPHAVLHTDAVQAVPWLDVAAATAGCDLVAISGHKFGGPKGVGVLVVRNGVTLLPEIEGGGQERGLRAGTVNVRRCGRARHGPAGHPRAESRGGRADHQAARSAADRPARRDPVGDHQRRRRPEGRRQLPPGIPRSRSRGAARHARRARCVRSRGFVVLVGRDGAVARTGGHGTLAARRARVDPAQPRLRVDRLRCEHRAST